MIVEVLTEFNLNEKFIAFTGNNCNNNFGGRNRNGEQNVFTKSKEVLREASIGLDLDDENDE